MLAEVTALMVALMTPTAGIVLPHGQSVMHDNHALVLVGAVCEPDIRAPNACH